MKFLVIVFSLVLVSTVPVVSSAPVKHKSLDRKRWTLTESPNFRIVSDAKPKQVMKVAEQLERFRAFSVLLMGIDSAVSEDKSQLIITKTRGTWRALGLPNDFVSYTQPFQGRGANIFADIDGFTGTSLKKSNTGRAVVFHSLGLALLIDLGLRDKLPLWYFKGFAHYLSGYAEPKNVITIGSLEAMRGRLQGLFSHDGHFKNINVVSLMSRTSYTSRVSGKELSRKQRLKIDAEAFVMVHYFYGDPLRQKQLSTYIESRNSGKDIEMRIFEAFEMNPKELSIAISAYARSKMKVPAYDRGQIEKLLQLPAVESYQQSKLTSAEFWPIVYSSIVRLPNHIVSHAHKKELNEAVNQYLPKVESLFDSPPN